MHHLSVNIQLDVLPMDCSSTSILVLFLTLSPLTLFWGDIASANPALNSITSMSVPDQQHIPSCVARSQAAYGQAQLCSSKQARRLAIARSHVAWPRAAHMGRSHGNAHTHGMAHGPSLIGCWENNLCGWYTIRQLFE